MNSKTKEKIFVGVGVIVSAILITRLITTPFFMAVAFGGMALFLLGGVIKLATEAVIESYWYNDLKCWVWRKLNV